MNEPNWDEAPEGTVGHATGGMTKLPVLVGEDWYQHVYTGSRHKFAAAPEHLYSWSRSELQNYIQRPAAAPEPQAWNGEGLPPVGTVCEVKGYPEGDFVEALVIAYNDDQSMFWYCTDGINGIHETSKAEFRPTRTPEQIAAQEREKAVLAIGQILIDNREYCNEYNLARLIYDAGYRKK